MVWFGVFLGVAGDVFLAGFVLLFVWFTCEWGLSVESVPVFECKGDLVHEAVLAFE